jgi:nicotinate-nucleotide adenylyltransferase
MRIALFGGSFNPVHLGHKKLVEEVAKEFNIDRVIIMPTWKTPLKDNRSFANAELRLDMCKLAFQNLSTVEVSDMEIKRQGNSYTYLTLNSLKEKYPNDELFMLVGADMFLSLEKWKNFKDIFKMTSIIAVPRNCDNHKLLLHSEKLAKLYGCKSFVMNHKVMDVSSTEIRQKLSGSQDVSKLLDKNVYEYIKEHHLYGT